MSLAIPVLKRSNSKLTTSHAVSSDTADDNGSMYRVDSMVFESVEIPRTMLPPAIRVSLATASIRSSCNSQSPTLCRESSVMSLVSSALGMFYSSDLIGLSSTASPTFPA